MAPDSWLQCACGSSSLIRNRTLDHLDWELESYPLDNQGSPYSFIVFYLPGIQQVLKMWGATRRTVFIYKDSTD